MVSKGQPTVDVPAIGMSYTVQLDNTRNIVMQTHVAGDCGPAVLNAALDKVAAAINRQAAIYQIKELRKSVRLQNKQLRRVSEDLIRITEDHERKWKMSGRKGVFNLTAEQQKHREGVHTTQERFKEEIADLEREIAELEAVRDGTDSGTNR